MWGVRLGVEDFGLTNGGANLSSRRNIRIPVGLRGRLPPNKAAGLFWKSLAPPKPWAKALMQTLQTTGCRAHALSKTAVVASTYR